MKFFGPIVWFVHLHVLKMALDSCCSWTHNKEQKSKGGIFSFRSFHTSMSLPKHQSASFENRYLKLAFKWSSRLEDLNWIWTLSTIHQGYWVFCSRFQKLCKLGSVKAKIISKLVPMGIDDFILLLMKLKMIISHPLAQHISTLISTSFC